MGAQRPQVVARRARKQRRRQFVRIDRILIGKQAVFAEEGQVEGDVMPEQNRISRRTRGSAGGDP